MFIIEFEHLIIPILLCIFSFIIVCVFLLRKYSSYFKFEEQKKTENEIIDDELNRVLVDIKDDDNMKENNVTINKKKNKNEKDN